MNLLEVLDHIPIEATISLQTRLRNTLYSFDDRESLRPRGTWEGTADGYADGELVYDTWTCSECGHTVDTDDPDDLTEFCPNCGAKMEVNGHAKVE